MVEKNSNQSKRKYDIARHHAWAGSILLSVLLAIRIFLEMTDMEDIPDRIIIPIGIIIIIYILVALFYTYKYRSSLNQDEKLKETKIMSVSNDLEKEKLKADIEKDRLKLEKKKAKAEAKKAKKNK